MVDSLNRFGLTIEFDDLRALQKGSDTPATRATAWYADSLDGGCDVLVPLEQVRVLVEDAAGSAVPFPVLVTPDFSRTIRVEVTMPEPIPGTPHVNNPRCETTLQIESSLRFTLSAADYDGDGDALCPCPR